jgi:hypothetical protein
MLATNVERIFIVICKRSALLLLLGLELIVSLGCFDITKAEFPSNIEPKTCSECTQYYCKDAIETCSKNLSCNERQHCIDECQLGGKGTGACDEQCLAQEFTFGLHTDVSICQGKHCPNLCKRQCGGFTYRVDGCDSCIQAHCCDESIACTNEPSCLDINLCNSDCTPGDFGCYYDCVHELVPDAGPTSVEFHDCIVSGCPVECGIGNAWACIGITENIEIVRRETTVSLRFFDLSNKLVEGVSVVMCGWSDQECEDPLVIGQDGADGYVNLTYEIDPQTTTLVRFEISKPGRVSGTLTFSDPLSYGIKSDWVLLTPEELEYLGGFLKAEILPDRGHAQILMYDCSINAARDLVVSVPGIEGETTFYPRNYLPDLTVKYTDSSGHAGIANLPAGSIVIEAAPFGQEDSPVLGTTITVRPGAISYVVMWPR